MGCKADEEIMDRYKIGTQVTTPEGDGVVRKNEKHSWRQGVKIGGIRSLRWFWPKEMSINTGEN